MPNNTWTGTDYSNDITGVTCSQQGVKVTSSTQWCINGNNSWKYARDPLISTQLWARWRSLTDTFQQGKTYKLSFKLLLKQGTIDVWFEEADDDSLKSSVRCTAHDDVQDISLTRVITSEDLNRMSVRINAVTDDTLAYMDNMSIIEV